MKVRTIVISVIVTASLIGGAGYGAYYQMQSRKKPVDVVPVANVNFGFWGDNSSTSGTIISQNIQNVRLDGDKTLIKVYVKEGDEVKVGDPLLEYDMTLTELQREMENLTKQTLELNLKSLQKNLEKWQRTSPSASLERTEHILTAVSDELFEDDGLEDSNGQPIGETTAPDQNDGGNHTDPGNGSGASEGDGSQGSGDAIDGNDGDNGGTGGEVIGGDLLEEDAPGTSVPENPAGEQEDPGQELIDDEMDTPGLTEDGNSELIDSFEEDSEDGDVDSLIEDDGDEISDGTQEISQSVLKNINRFLARVNLLPDEEELDQLYLPDIEQALKIYRKKLAVSEKEKIRQDLLGEKRTRNIYSLKPGIEVMIGEDTAKVLKQAYARTCAYQFIYHMNQISADVTTVNRLSDEEIKALETLIRTALDSYYEIPKDAFEDHLELLTPCQEKLGALLVRLKDLEVLDETEADPDETESESEDYDGYDDDYDDFDGYDPDDYELYTAAEIKEMIETIEMDIEECELDIRESELKLKQFDRELDKKIVKSTMNGVVMSAGSMEDDAVAENFIVITGEAGMYVKGTLNELELGTVSIGDTVQGTSYETGMNFVAKITEISEFPTENNDYYYFWGNSGNSNASYYPFLAYIENTEGLEEGEVELQIVSDSPSTGIYLEEFFVRSENGNKKYVYIQGEDGLLKKQYVETGVSVYGEVEIKRGLSRSDKIAFPYGKDVTEGAQTREVDNLDSAYGYYY